MPKTVVLFRGQCAGCWLASGKAAQSIAAFTTTILSVLLIGANILGNRRRLLPMRRLDGKKMAGTFSIEQKEIYGELTLAGPKTSLYLHDRDYFSPLNLPDQSLKGTLHDLTKVSLLRCIMLSGPGSATRGTERYSFSTLFPHFALFGDRFIGPNDSKIVELKFSIDDATALFYDFDAFGHLIHPEQFINQLVDAQ
jgi:hypothetical protein